MRQSCNFETTSFYLLKEKGEIRKVLLFEFSVPFEIKTLIKFMCSFNNLQTIKALIIHKLSKFQMQKFYNCLW